GRGVSGLVGARPLAQLLGLAGPATTSGAPVGAGLVLAGVLRGVGLVGSRRLGRVLRPLSGTGVDRVLIGTCRRVSGLVGARPLPGGRALPGAAAARAAAVAAGLGLVGALGGVGLVGGRRVGGVLRRLACPGVGRVLLGISRGARGLVGARPLAR